MANTTLSDLVVLPLPGFNFGMMLFCGFFTSILLLFLIFVQQNLSVE